MSGSSSKGSSRPVDMTPEAFKNLQQPFAQVLGQMLGFAPAGQQPAGTPGVPGAAGAPVTGAPATAPFQGGSATKTDRNLFNSQNSLFDNSVPNQLAKPAPAPAPVATGNGNPAFTPTGDISDILRGIPQYQGPLTAGIGANEQALLDKLMAGTSGTGGQVSPAQQALMDIMKGGGVTGYQGQGSLADYAKMLQGSAQTAGYDPNGNNPFVQAAIEAAQRPTFQALEETLSRTLPGRFTAAGQFINPQGSSAFDRAAAMAARDSSQTAADIATNISFGSFEGERGRQFEAQEAARAREAAALEAEQGRRATGQEAAADRSLDAAKALPGVSKQEIDTTIANLQAQALPRLIQEMGIERGLEAFQNRMNSLLTTLGIAGGATSPTIGNSSTQKSASFGLK